ncbi:hypothetical protein [Photorhabdus sp. RM323S]|uniref:hypothetical protein n=1 Tax=Photorhabdus sp. RM323S TaxID=3342828 RepID=UPI0036DBE52C
MSDNKRHMHADSMAQYAQDASRTDEPWLLWESSLDDGNSWRSLTDHPSWVVEVKYRRKPEIINISYPKPVCYRLEKGQQYWTPALTGDVRPDCWDDSKFDFHSLKNGFIHLTEEAAKQHAEALVKVMGGEF